MGAALVGIFLAVVAAAGIGLVAGLLAAVGVPRGTIDTGEYTVLSLQVSVNRVIVVVEERFTDKEPQWRLYSLDPGSFVTPLRDFEGKTYFTMKVTQHELGKRIELRISESSEWQEATGRYMA